jgi:hypothetical protein
LIAIRIELNGISAIQAMHNGVILKVIVTWCCLDCQCQRLSNQPSQVATEHIQGFRFSWTESRFVQAANESYLSEHSFELNEIITWEYSVANVCVRGKSWSEVSRNVKLTPMDISPSVPLYTSL